jgi:hypothetical protein
MTCFSHPKAYTTVCPACHGNGGYTTLGFNNRLVVNPCFVCRGTRSVCRDCYYGASVPGASETAESPTQATDVARQVVLNAGINSSE